MSIGSWIYLWAFYSVPLIYISVFVPVPYCLASRCLDWGIRCRFPYAPVRREKNLRFLHFREKYRHPWDRSWVILGNWAVVCVNQELETRWQWGALASISKSRWHTGTRCSHPSPTNDTSLAFRGPLVLRHNSRNWVKGRDQKITMYINYICVLYIYYIKIQYVKILYMIYNIYLYYNNYILGLYLTI